MVKVHEELGHRNEHQHEAHDGDDRFAKLDIILTDISSHEIDVHEPQNGITCVYQERIRIEEYGRHKRERQEKDSDDAFVGGLLDVPDGRVKKRRQEDKNEVDGDVPVVAAEYRKELRESDRVKKRRLNKEGYSCDNDGVKQDLRVKGYYPLPLELGPPHEVTRDQHVAVNGCVAQGFHYPGEVIVHSSGHALKDFALGKEMEHYDHEHRDDPQ